MKSVAARNKIALESVFLPVFPASDTGLRFVKIAQRNVFSFEDDVGVFGHEIRDRRCKTVLNLVIETSIDQSVSCGQATFWQDVCEWANRRGLFQLDQGIGHAVKNGK